MIEYRIKTLNDESIMRRGRGLRPNGKGLKVLAMLELLYDPLLHLECQDKRTESIAHSLDRPGLDYLDV